MFKKLDEFKALNGYLAEAGEFGNVPRMDTYFPPEDEIPTDADQRGRYAIHLQVAQGSNHAKLIAGGDWNERAVKAMDSEEFRLTFGKLLDGSYGTYLEGTPDRKFVFEAANAELLQWNIYIGENQVNEDGESFSPYLDVIFVRDALNPKAVPTTFSWPWRVNR